MATTKERTAAKRTVKKAQETQHSMSSRADARARPEGHKRRKPGATVEANSSISRSDQGRNSRLSEPRMSANDAVSSASPADGRPVHGTRKSG